MNNDNQIEQIGDYKIAINKEREVLVSLPLRHDLPEKAFVIYDGGDHALLQRNPETALLLDYVTEEFKYYVPRSEKLYIAEFGGDFADFSTMRWTYVAKIKNEKIPIEKLPPSREEIFAKLAKAKKDGNLEDAANALAEEFNIL